MATPNSKATLKEYCLRKLGKPVIEINIDDDQMDDRIDEAFLYYQDYHFDGVEKTWLKHQVTADDKTNEYITVTDSNTIGIMANSINHKPLNLSTNYEIRENNFIYDKKLYDKYKTDYIKETGSLDRPIWEIFCDYLDSLNA